MHWTRFLSTFVICNIWPHKLPFCLCAWQIMFVTEVNHMPTCPPFNYQLPLWVPDTWAEPITINFILWLVGKWSGDAFFSGIMKILQRGQARKVRSSDDFQAFVENWHQKYAKSQSIWFSGLLANNPGGWFPDDMLCSSRKERQGAARSALGNVSCAQEGTRRRKTIPEDPSSAQGKYREREQFFLSTRMISSPYRMH